MYEWILYTDIASKLISYRDWMLKTYREKRRIKWNMCKHPRLT